MDKDLAIIRSQQLPNKLSVAGGGDYNKIWIRDNVYVALALTAAGQIAEAATIYAELCKIIARYETVLDYPTYPTTDAELLHPRFTVSGGLVPNPWSNKQHDAVGALLYGIGQIYAIDSQLISAAVQRIAQKLIHYLETCNYQEDPDNGMWEETPTLHASSLAACIRGIESVSSFCQFNPSQLAQAKANLEQLLPRESAAHAVDLALLSLVWPYGYKRLELVTAVESQLLRQRGVIRYIGDRYEAKSEAEPQWVMGMPWLGIAYFELGDITKARAYLAHTERLYTDNGLPEAYLAHNHIAPHTPLAWSHAMAIVLRAKLASQPAV